MHGGGALLKNLDKLITERTGIDCIIANNPLDCVAIGTTAVLGNIDTLKNIIEMAHGKRR